MNKEGLITWEFKDGSTLETITSPIGEVAGPVRYFTEEEKEAIRADSRTDVLIAKDYNSSVDVINAIKNKRLREVAPK